MIKNLLRIYFNEYLHLSENNTNLKKKIILSLCTYSIYVK